MNMKKKELIEVIKVILFKLERDQPAGIEILSVGIENKIKEYVRTINRSN